jgi:hypothetical protein
MPEPRQPWIVLSRHEPARVDAPTWREKARTFLHADVDAGEISRALLEGERIRVRVASLRRPEVASDVIVGAATIEDATEQRMRANAAVRAIGGAGFDALVSAARTVWLIESQADPRFALVVAATISMVVLGPIVPPEGDTIFAVKTARERLDASGWR